MPYIRTIFIGLGGAGIQTIDLLKQKYLASNNGELPKSIKFLAIDSDYNRRGVELTNDEFAWLGSNHAYDYYLQNPQRYNIPEHNIGYLRNIGGFGSGMCRSNGKYLFRINEQEISYKISALYHKLSSVHINDAILMPNIDVHIITSSCGGTGSGVFIELAKLVRKVIPNSRVFAYLYSDAFYRGLIPCGWNIMENSCASILEMNWDKEYFDFCVWIGNKISDRYIIPLEDAQQRLSEMLKYVSSQPLYYSEFEELRDTGRICNFISVGCHKLTYTKEELLKKIIMFNVICRALDGAVLDYKGEYINIVSDQVQKLERFGNQGYNVYGQNILLFEQDLTSKVPGLIEECYSGLISKINGAIRDSAGIKQILRELHHLEGEIFERLDDAVYNHKECDRYIYKMNDQLSFLNNEMYKMSKSFLHVIYRDRIAALNNDIATLNDDKLEVNYNKKTLECVIRTYKGVLERVRCVSELLNDMMCKLERVLEEELHFEKIEKSIINSDVTSLIDINSLPFDETDAFSELFSEGMGSIIEYRRFIDIIDRHIPHGTCFNYITNEERLFSPKFSYSMHDESTGNIMDVCEEWFIKHPYDLKPEFLNNLHQEYNNNSFFDVTGDNEIIVMSKRGYNDWEQVIENRIQLLKDPNERYCPFSDSDYESRFLNEFN